MARPLRVDVEGGWYHVVARGIERREIVETDRDYEHFLELLAEMSERYGVEIHAYALMGNHYHLLIKTPLANASVSIQWLNVSYSVWFNRKRERVGHVFQGRFGSVLIDGQGSWALGASVYVHLNPARRMGLGLGKAANRAEGLGLKAPSREALKERLRVLRKYPWSSFRAYAGYEADPKWLRTEELLRRAGGRRRYRRHVLMHVTRGIEPEGFEDLAGRVSLGSRAFLDKVKTLVKKVSREQPGRREVARRAPMAAILKVVEEERGEKFAEFSERYGDWGRDLVLYLARKRSGLTLREIGEACGGLEYKAVSKAIQRFEASLRKDDALRRLAPRCLASLSTVET